MIPIWWSFVAAAPDDRSSGRRGEWLWLFVKNKISHNATLNPASSSQLNFVESGYFFCIIYVLFYFELISDHKQSPFIFLLIGAVSYDFALKIKAKWWFCFDFQSKIIILPWFSKQNHKKTPKTARQSPVVISPKTQKTLFFACFLRYFAWFDQ